VLPLPEGARDPKRQTIRNREELRRPGGTRDRGASGERVEVAGSTGLEPAASGVTGRRSNQLNYDPAKTFECNANSKNDSSPD
jgi:hypothetical protein